MVDRVCREVSVSFKLLVTRIQLEQGAIDYVWDGSSGHYRNEGMLGEAARRGAQMILQRVMEWEVEEFLGRGRYERSQDGALRGYRNGYEPKKVHMTEGSIELQVPQVRDALIVLLSSKQLSDVTDFEGKALLKEDMLERVNDLLESGQIRSILFTEFVVQ